MFSKFKPSIIINYFYITLNSYKLIVVYFLLGLLFSHSLIAQTSPIDSLKNVLKVEKEDTNKVNSLNRLAKEFLNISEYDTVRYYAVQAKNIAENIKFKKGIANAYNLMGIAYLDQGNNTEALKNIFISLKINEEIGNKKGIANAYTNIGILYDFQGNFPEALKNHFASLKISEGLGNKKNILGSYTNIGSVYSNLHNYSEAQKYILLALKIAEEINDKASLARSYCNLGINYENQGNHLNALEMLFSGLKISKEIGEKRGVANIYSNIGNVYALQKNYKEAMQNILEAIKIDTAIGDLLDISHCYINIGSILIEQQNYLSAIDYLNKGLQIAQVVGNKAGIKVSYDGLYKAYKSLGNWQLAFENYKLYSDMKDSLFNEDKSEEIGRIEAKAEFDKQQAITDAQHQNEVKLVEQEATLKQLKTEKEKSLLQYAFIGSLLALLFLSLLGYLLFKQKQTQSENAKIVLENKLLRTQMDPHFIFNSLGSIQAMIVEENYHAALMYLGEFSNLLRMTLQNSFQVQVKLNDEVKFLNHYLSLEKLRLNETLNIKIEKDEMLDNIKVPPMIIQPIIENAIKHGIMHKTEGMGNVSIEFKMDEPKENIICTVEDNGVGRTKSKELNIWRKKDYDSKGIEITTSRINMLNHDRKENLYGINIVDLYDDQKKSLGTKVEIKFPIIYS